MTIETYTHRTYRDGTHAIRYMARLNGTRWMPQPYHVVSSYNDMAKSPKRTGQGVKLVVVHESGRRFESASEAARAYGMNSASVLHAARRGIATRAGKFELVAA